MEDDYLLSEKMWIKKIFYIQNQLLDIIIDIAEIEYLEFGDYPIYKRDDGLEYWLENERMVSSTFSEKLVAKLNFLYHNDPPTGLAFIKRITNHKTNRSFKKNNRSGNEVFWISKVEQKLLQKLNKKWKL